MSGPSTPTSSPYAARAGAGAPTLPWHRVLVRVVLVVVPGQVVGALIATVLVLGVDLGAHPHATALFWVLPGAVAGAGVALFLLRPGTARPVPVLGTAAAVGAAAVLLLVLLGQARVPNASLAGQVPALLGGILGCVAVQTAVAVGGWFLRRRVRPA